MAILKNCELWFAKLDPKRPNRKFNPENPTWEIQLRTKSKETKKEWETLGLNVKAVVPDEGDPYFRVNLNKKSLNKEGEPANPVKVVDAKLKEIDPTTIGNGSIGNVRIYQYEYTKKTGGTGIVSTVMAVQVTKHVVYTPKPSEDFDALDEDTETVGETKPTDDLPDADF